MQEIDTTGIAMFNYEARNMQELQCGITRTLNKNKNRDVEDCHFQIQSYGCTREIKWRRGILIKQYRTEMTSIATSKAIALTILDVQDIATRILNEDKVRGSCYSNCQIENYSHARGTNRQFPNVNLWL